MNSIGDRYSDLSRDYSEDRKIAAKTEAAFRRGYNQAYEAAINHIRAGATLEQLCSHGDRIQDWRENSTREGLGHVAPPIFQKGL